MFAPKLCEHNIRISTSMENEQNRLSVCMCAWHFAHQSYRQSSEFVICYRKSPYNKRCEQIISDHVFLPYCIKISNVMTVLRKFKTRRHLEFFFFFKKKGSKILLSVFAVRWKKDVVVYAVHDIWISSSLISSLVLYDRVCLVQIIQCLMLHQNYHQNCIVPCVFHKS